MAEGSGAGYRVYEPIPVCLLNRMLQFRIGGRVCSALASTIEKLTGLEWKKYLHSNKYRLREHFKSMNVNSSLRFLFLLVTCTLQGHCNCNPLHTLTSPSKSYMRKVPISSRQQMIFLSFLSHWLTPANRDRNCPNWQVEGTSHDHINTRSPTEHRKKNHLLWLQ